MNNFQRIAAVLCLCIALMGCSDDTTAQSESKGAAPAVSAQFTPMDSAGLDAYLKENQGKPTMLMFWTTWCPSCKEHFPNMEKLAQEDSDTVNVLTVSLDENKDALTRYFKDKNLGVAVYHGDQSIAARFGVEAIPTMVFFNKSGEPVFAQPGGFPYDMLVTYAKKLAAE